MRDYSAILKSNHQVALGNFILEKQSPLAFVSLWSYTIYYYCTETKAIAEGHNNCSNTSERPAHRTHLLSSFMEGPHNFLAELSNL